jgi:hypothetical protein
MENERATGQQEAIEDEREVGKATTNRFEQGTILVTIARRIMHYCRQSKRNSFGLFNTMLHCWFVLLKAPVIADSDSVSIFSGLYCECTTLMSEIYLWMVSSMQNLQFVVAIFFSNARSKTHRKNCPLKQKVPAHRKKCPLRASP